MCVTIYLDLHTSSVNTRLTIQLIWFADFSSPSLVAVVRATAGAALDWAAIAAAQLGCPEISALQQVFGPAAQGLALRGQHILCDISTGVARPMIPADHRRGIFSSLHHIAHPGARATRRLISSRFVWKSMNKDINS